MHKKQTFKIISMITRILIIMILTFAVYIFYQQRDDFINSFDTKPLIPYVVTGLVFSLLYLRLKRYLGFTETYLHEACHLLLAIITLNKAVSFHVTETKGSVSYEGEANFLVSLAPYYLPLLTFFLMFISILTTDVYSIFIKHAVALTYTWYILVLLRQPFGNKDIKKTGILFSYSFIILTNIANGWFILYYLQNLGV